jgi:hypothetical protein
MENIKTINKLKEGLKKWLKTIYVGDGKYKFAAHSTKMYCLDAITLAIDLENMLGNNLDDKKTNVVKYLNSRQDPTTGFFKEEFETEELNERENPRIKEMARTYLSFQTCGAYSVLNKFPLYQFKFYKNLLIHQNMINYLSNNIPWKVSPWGAGGMIDSISTMLTMNVDKGFVEYQKPLNLIFEWLNKNQNSETGLWGDVNAQGLTGLVNGGYHLTRGTYFYHKRELKYVKKIIDTIITHVKINKKFKKFNGDGCYDLDAFFLLDQCHRRIPSYRKDEIISICIQRMNNIFSFRNPDGGFSFEPGKSEVEHNYFKVTEGRDESDVQGTVFYLQTIISILSIINSKKSNFFKNSSTHGVLN